jgi:hypothetical protein
MSRTPARIPARAVALWQAGDEEGATKLAKLRSRQLRNRLGPPGRGKVAPAASEGAVVTPGATLPQRLIRVAPKAKASPPPSPPSDPEPSVEQIDRIDTREEAEAIYRDVRARMAGGTVRCPQCEGAVPVGADPVRFASLAEKGLAALNRIEQIDARRPKPPSVDEVTRRIVEVADRAVERIGVLVSEEAMDFAAARAEHEAWLATLGTIGSEAVRRLGLVLDGTPHDPRA